MLHDVMVLIRGSREIVRVDAENGDAAAEAAHALRPSGTVVGVSPTPQNAADLPAYAREPSPLEGASLPDDDEDSEAPPSARELAMAPKRRPGRPRKTPPEAA